MNKGRGMGPRGVITMGGLPGGTPTGGCKEGRGGGGSVGLSWGLGVGILAEEDEGEQMAAVSEGDVADEVDGARAEAHEGPPGEGILRRRSATGDPQDSGVSSCTPPPQSSLLSPPGPCPGLHSAPGSAAWVSL